MDKEQYQALEAKVNLLMALGAAIQNEDMLRVVDIKLTRILDII